MWPLTFMDPEVITQAYNRISPHIHRTPLLQSHLLNEKLKCEIYFKCENLQKVGAFKARGALNTLLHLKEQNQLPKEVVAYSSGNHAQAVAWACGKLGVKSTILIPNNASPIKILATKSYGAEVILTSTRQEAENIAREKMKSAYLIPPYDHDDIIAGQGTAAFEAWMEQDSFHAVFAPCGGGGLISGTYLASQLFSPAAQIFACEPAIANDAARSYKTGMIQGFETMPPTIADGTRTLRISERTFQYIQKLSGFYEISEDNIIYWTQWLTHLLKLSLEPTSALGMAGAHEWIQQGNKHKKILVILSGGNVDPSTQKILWEKNCLES